jgi:polysaccharide deacetylase family protein (PEP-CTERM system associated)
MSNLSSRQWRSDPPHVPVVETSHTATILSFDVEEHYRIEAAAHLNVPATLKAHYEARLEPSTGWLLDQLDQRGIKATFFVVGQLARSHPKLIQRIAERGHEVGSHSWDHRRLHHHDSASFREDLRLSRDAIEQASGQPVLGYRAPTFSIVTKNAWALDVLAEEGFLYDSSIFPVRHDRYGVPDAPRAPFRALGFQQEILEFPIATLRLWRWNLPVGGGGYFRLFPLALLNRALWQIQVSCTPSVAMLYFHPWEFDPEQQRLPLGRLSSFRTYVGIQSSRPRLLQLMEQRRFSRAGDVAQRLLSERNELPAFSLTGKPIPQETKERAPVGASVVRTNRAPTHLTENYRFPPLP